MSLLDLAYGGPPPAGSSFYYSKLLFGWGNRVQDYHYNVWQALAGLKWRYSRHPVQLGCLRVLREQHL